MATKEFFTLENKIKLGTLICTACSLYFAIKSDIRDLATQKKFEVEHLQYQITELKECCDNKRNTSNKLAIKDHVAVMPHGVEYEQDND